MRFRERLSRVCAALTLGAAVVLGTSGAEAQQALPDLIKPPSGLNLGGTSFYDGAGPTEPGFVFIQYGRQQFLNKATDSTGGTSATFTSPFLGVTTALPQVLYFSPLKLGTGVFGYMFLASAASFSSSFSRPGLQLTDNGVGFGDITTGPFYQSAPVIRDGRPFLFYRAEFDVILPVGKFDPTKDINQSSGFYSLNPYLAVTVLPTPELEFSARFNYLYNFQTSRIADPPPIPGLVFHTGQAGSLGWVNFTGSYAVEKDFSVGFNGYYLRQFDNDKLNGTSINGTRQEVLYLGPGFHWHVSPHNIVNFNVYLPLETKNSFQGPQVNVQYIHPF